MDQSMRAALDSYEAKGDLLQIDRPVDWNFEVAAYLWKYRNGPALVFERVKGYEVPIVGNLLNCRAKLGHSFGLEEREVQPFLVEALDNPIPPEVVSCGACQEVVIEQADILRDLPVPVISEHDGGRYISAGVFIAKHPDSGRRNVSICRIQVLGPDRIACYMAPTHLYGFLQRHRELGSRMEVAIVVGNHPAIMVASQMLVPDDELGIAGGMFGEPVRLVRCKSVDLEVPADAEIVLEGVIDPGETHLEGPFGEFPGTYSPARNNPLVRINLMTTRERPLFQMIVGSNHPEHLWTGAIAREATLFRSVRAVVPTVKGVSLTEGGVCRFHAVVAIAKRTEGEGKLAALAALTSQDLLKHITVVDDDIDYFDSTEVEWAVATRMRAESDIQIIRDVKSNPVDPMSVDRTISKVIIDATLRTDERAAAYGQRAGVPESVMKRVISEDEP
jgi:2,5-furandicarboxylate decarboxylase 1